MKAILKITTLFLLIITTTSCFFDGVRGNGNVEIKNRKISDDFSAIKVSRGLEVYLTKSNKLKLVVEADENLHDLITTEVRDGTLVITSTKNIGIAEAKKIHLSVENLNKIGLSSGAQVFSENTLNTDELEVSASSGAIAKLKLKVDDLSCDSSSGAIVNLEGKASNFKVRSSSGSIVKSYDLNAKNCEAKATSGANISVYVNGSIEAKATSGANIKYKGNPTIENTDKSSGGSINKI